ncbi:hypothetical protein [Deinococcus radiodurans]|jgi:hypothetical protein|uniref:Uncharacterized protein n=2 Tax=Deinococcus radiodurans TaxID=1299 RepID=Q9RW52_DEIRA|nr:hypothetical protein [Deinococcus radiodurans]AAF10401.1 hypothetical protein DR_0817 [Deinococcus radiodurans R1 = ATCC 13939 = DSM 20539]QEM70328.1 hypothetical protein DXG80_00145 [Deinococcus radiodurans]QIP28942.1 hypothetical protein HAV23_06995 [Deinococcus radiodurans]QIP32349.1 hypothetical protein HAV35_09795 [Deinococcus radiodurans]UDK99980.1 hypothetical protein E5E91_04240 [Deinococcus radiodurans R1 = ATCC 13939 = DSM 20539]
MGRLGHDPAALEWRDCPRCRYPMSRWDRVRATPERVWARWQPDEWTLPWHIIIFGALLLLSLTSGPSLLGLALSIGGRVTSQLTFVLVNGLGLVAVTVWGFFDYRSRLNKREQLARKLAPDDWVCPRCLQAEVRRRL